MSKHSSHKTVAQNRRARGGSAALMLTLVLALLVGTYAASIGKHALSERQNELRRQSIALLDAAITAVDQSGLSSDSVVRLPVDKASGRWVVVETIDRSDDGIQFQATFYHNDQPGLSIRRPARNDP